MVVPRLETPRRRSAPSIGGEARAWVEGSGILPGAASLRAWQAYALERALEVDSRGRLRWPVVVLTTSRQSGKSWLLRSAAWWRLHQEERFGEAQVVLHVANKERTAREVWRPAARHAVDIYGKSAAKFGAGREEIELPSGARWLVQAATQNAGVGYSLSMAVVDEAWNVDRGVVEDAIMPAMAEREQPQLWLVSTAGDSSSDLLRTYREQALQDRTGKGGILLLEWSAPPEAPYDAEETWRWASPEWTRRRREFLRGRVSTVAEPVFRTQYLNQWVQAVDGWVPASVWARGYSTLEPSPEERPEAVAVEVAPDGSRFGMVAAWKVDGGILVRALVTLSSSALWRQVEEWRPRVLLLPPSLLVHYTGRLRAVQVGSLEMGRHMAGVSRCIADGQLLHHPEDHNLNDHVGRAVAVTTDQGVRLSTSRSAGPIEAARAMVWAVGECLRPAQPRPKVRAAS